MVLFRIKADSATWRPDSFCPCRFARSRPVVDVTALGKSRRPTGIFVKDTPEFGSHWCFEFYCGFGARVPMREPGFETAPIKFLPNATEALMTPPYRAPTTPRLVTSWPVR